MNQGILVLTRTDDTTPNPAKLLAPTRKQAELSSRAGSQMARCGVVQLVALENRVLTYPLFVLLIQHAAGDGWKRKP